MNRRTKFTFLILLILLPCSTFGQLRLPKLVSDGMILQRNDEVTIWGWDEPGQSITVNFLDDTYQTFTNDLGKWKINLEPYSTGGPYEMTIHGSESITIRDILIGDVWVASGQSNMELWMGRVSPVYPKVIANSENPMIRQFLVPDEYDFKQERADLSDGSWQKANPQTVLNFSAVAYFFAKKLYGEYEVPIGIINASLGGSPAEAWISEKTLQKKFPHYYEEAVRFKNDALIDSIQQADQERSRDWHERSLKSDRGYQSEKNWREPDFDTSDWATMQIPGYWADTKLGDINGVVWFSRTFEIPSDFANREADLNMGRIVDADSVFVNGTFVGSTGYQYPPRWYTIPEGVLKSGENIITARVINQQGRGGFVLDKPYEITIDDHKIDLKGEWKYKLGAEMPPLQSQTFVRWKPAGLFNAMISPLLNYSIKGVIWYQGESNTDRPVEYEDLFSTMIKDWREHWNEDDFPFLFVQLANFMESKSEPSESEWARLRESQLNALDVPNTAMAVTIDIGEWNDIHPLNKKDVGERLALAARNLVYGEKNLVYSGPEFKSMTVEGNRATLRFDHIGSGLTTDDGNLPQHFAIAGLDSTFVWANAKIKGNTIVIWSDEVENPIAVRYAWANNPEGANLYNEEGLPASPFRTDDWETENNHE